MILINLLPHREMARKRARQEFNIFLGLAAVLGALIAFLIGGWYEVLITAQEGNNNYLTGQIKKLDDEIKEVASLQDEIAALKARQEAVENLQADRNLPVHLMNSAVSKLPAGMYLQSLKQENQNVLVKGVAQSNERVSELLRNLSRTGEWVTNPDLVEIVAAEVALNPKEKRRAYNFTVRAQLLRASDVTAAVGAASAPRAAASKGAGA